MNFSHPVELAGTIEAWLDDPRAEAAPASPTGSRCSPPTAVTPADLRRTHGVSALDLGGQHAADALLLVASSDRTRASK